MREPLALRYRPRVFGDVCGQRPVTAVLYRLCVRDALPAGVLLAGEYGSGKTTLARMAAKAVNCTAPPGKPGAWPCNACDSCKLADAGTHPNIEELDAASFGGVEQIRAVRDRACYGVGRGYRVFIIDEAHGLSGPAFESLLTILENPPERVKFILCTTRPDAVPETVRSRLSPFRFGAIPAAVIRDRLAYICQQEGITAEPELLAAIAESARGAMRDAIVQLDQLSSVGIGSLSMWRELTGETDCGPVILAAAADGDAASMYEAMDAALAAYGDARQVANQLVSCLKELLLLAGGGTVLAHGERLAARQALADRLGPARLAAVMQALWDLFTRVQAVDREQALVLMLSVVSRRLAPPPAAGEEASFEEIRAAMGTPA